MTLPSPRISSSNLFTFVIIAHHSREIVHSAVTRHPTDAWVAQQLREATPWNRKPRFLIRDNDKKFGKQVSTVARSSDIKEMLTPLKSPRANAICEHFFGSLKRESFDHFLIFREVQLRCIVQEYVAYYNQHRPHLGFQQRIPIWFVNRRPPTSDRVQGKVIAMPILSGLHHSYTYAGTGL